MSSSRSRSSTLNILCSDDGGKQSTHPFVHNEITCPFSGSFHLEDSKGSAAMN